MRAKIAAKDGAERERERERERLRERERERRQRRREIARGWPRKIALRDRARRRHGHVVADRCQRELAPKVCHLRAENGGVFA